MDLLTFEELRMLVVEHCGNNNPSVFVIKDGNYIDFTVYLDSDSDIIIEVQDGGDEDIH